jgi:hypothetical protein
VRLVNLRGYAKFKREMSAEECDAPKESHGQGNLIAPQLLGPKKNFTNVGGLTNIV